MSAWRREWALDSDGSGFENRIATCRLGALDESLSLLEHYSPTCTVRIIVRPPKMYCQHLSGEQHCAWHIVRAQEVTIMHDRGQVRWGDSGSCKQAQKPSVVNGFAIQSLKAGPHLSVTVVKVSAPSPGSSTWGPPETLTDWTEG